MPCDFIEQHHWVATANFILNLYYGIVVSSLGLGGINAHVTHVENVSYLDFQYLSIFVLRYDLSLNIELTVSARPADK